MKSLMLVILGRVSSLDLVGAGRVLYGGGFGERGFQGWSDLAQGTVGWVANVL